MSFHDLFGVHSLIPYLSHQQVYPAERFNQDPLIRTYKGSVPRTLPGRRAGLWFPPRRSSAVRVRRVCCVCCVPQKYMPQSHVPGKLGGTKLYMVYTRATQGPQGYVCSWAPALRCAVVSLPQPCGGGSNSSALVAFVSLSRL